MGADDTAAHWLDSILGGLFVLAIPIFFIGTNVRWIALDPATYSAGYEKYDVARTTGLQREQLEEVARAFIDYFRGQPGELRPVVELRGERRELFNEREVAHMEDVQLLMQLVFGASAIAGAYSLVFAVGLLAMQRTEGLQTLGRLLLWSAGLTIALLLLVALISLVDFGELFTLFHQVSFRNDLWMLDPSTDYLVMLFPVGFWFDVTLKIAALTAAESLVLAILGFFLQHQ